jgi:hypothetical protein
VLGVPALPAVGDAAARQVVRRELDVDVVARRDADAEPAQTTREAREDRVAVLELDLERRAGKRLDDAADEAQRVFFDDRGQRFAAFLAAAALASARWGNGSSFDGVECGRQVSFAPRARFACGATRLRDGDGAAQVNFPFGTRVVAGVMLTAAIVFGAVGVAAGFAWDFVKDRAG